jgi:3-hydroxyacyl-[acyl-carrier-protein] dehydratase
MKTMNIESILNHLPHRYPFLLVDRVVDINPGESISAIKNVTYNEPFFTGHFPENPVMPGVLIVESLAQTAGLLALKTVEVPENHRALLYFAAIDNTRFKRIVYPGDQLQLHASLVNARRNIWKFAAEARVNDELACSSTITAARKDIPID